MDATHLHLMLNHFPILGTLFGFAVLLYGLWKKNKTVENIGFTTLIVVALVAIPVFLSGEEAEETVEKLDGVSEHFIEEHEEMAKVAIWLVSITAALALLTLIFSYIRRTRNVILKTITTLLAAATLVVMIIVGNYGGKIRHSELRDDTVTQNDHEVDD